MVSGDHDDKGIIWSPNIAPFDAHLIGLNLEDAAINAHANQVYEQLRKSGLDVLFDDRLARAGEKFSDADLIGIPARLTLSKRTMEQGKVEFKLRREPKAELITLEEAQRRIQESRQPKG